MITSGITEIDPFILTLPNNRIANNGRFGVYINSAASADLGYFLYLPQRPYLRGGFNQFDHGNGTYDVKNYSSSTIKAEVNWWEDMANSGSIDTSPTAEDRGYYLSRYVTEDDEELQELLAEAYQLENVDSVYTEAIDVLNQAAALAPDDSIAYHVMLGLARLYGKLDDRDGLLTNLDQLSGEYATQLMGKIALNYSVKVCAGAMDFPAALERSEAIIPIWSADAGATEALAWSLFDQAMIYSNMNTSTVVGKKSTTELANSNFMKILTDYPETEAARAVVAFFGLQKPIEFDSEIPGEFTLQACYPNPFNPNTTITFDLPELSNGTLTIYDLLSREVITLKNGQLNAGTHKQVWDGKNSVGMPVSTGIYICRLSVRSRESAKTFTATNKMVLLK